MKRLLGAIAILLLFSPAATGQDRSIMPKGRWWKMPEVAKRLDLSTEQQKRLDAVFTERSKQLIDLKANMEKSAIELRASLENFDSKPADVMKYAAEVGEARSQLFSKEIEMMVDIRRELNEEQWTKLRAALEQHSRRSGDQRRMPQRPNVPPRQN